MTNIYCIALHSKPKVYDRVLNDLKVKLLWGFNVCATQKLLLGLSNSGGKAVYILGI